jgi:hypothetical protein
MKSARDAIFIPQRLAVEGTVTVPKDISVLEIVPTETGERLGKLMALPKGARLEICGNGFHDRTVKALYEGRFCLVFLQDLEFVSNGLLGVGASTKI